MDFTQVLQSRRSIKNFSNQDVPQEKINNILNAARVAPSWGNHQCWKIIVVRNRDTINKISDTLGNNNVAKSGVQEAPLLVIICAEPHISSEVDKKEYYLVDSAIAMDHLILAASNEGLGTCWVGWFDENKIKSILNIPENYKVVTMTPVGYPSETPDTEYKRSIQDIGYSEKWGNYLH